jgi:hypothetical protein
VPGAFTKVKSGEFAGIHVDLIARANAVQAIPVLKQQFDHVDDPLLKMRIASALVRPGKKITHTRISSRNRQTGGRG